MQRKLISFDWAIKRILRSKVNFDILEGFLSELLKEDIKIIEVLESESNQDTLTDKFNRLDLKVKNKNDEIILIEIQYSAELDYLQRILYASSKAITEHMKEGMAYSKISKVISISILYFDFGDGDDYIYKGTTNFIGVHNHTQLKLNEKQKELYKTNLVEKIYPQYYLIKVRNFNDNAKDTLDEWINFLKNETIPENPKAKGLLKASQELDYLKMSKDEQLLYDKHEKDRHHEASIYESTYVIGEIMGMKKERVNSDKRLQEEKINSEKKLRDEKINNEKKLKEEKINITKNLLKANVAIDVIQLSTGLTKEEIELCKKN